MYSILRLIRGAMRTASSLILHILPLHSATVVAPLIGSLRLTMHRRSSRSAFVVRIGFPCNSPAVILLILVSPRWGDTAGNMAAVNFTKNENALTGGSDFFVAIMEFVSS